jgi:hypothetical protein
VTAVRVRAGACGYVIVVECRRTGVREVKLDMESACESVAEFGRRLAFRGPLKLKDILTRGLTGSPILEEATKSLPHAGCLIPSAVIKAAEVELGLNVPRSALIEFIADDDGIEKVEVDTHDSSASMLG